jgi:hypothetical protein
VRGQSSIARRVGAVASIVSMIGALAVPGQAVAAPPGPADPPPPHVTPPPPPVPVEVDPVNYRMVLAGDIIIGLSAAGMIVLAVGLGIRADAVTQRQALTVADVPDPDAIARQEQRVQTGTQLGIGGGVAAGVLLATGIALVATGYKRERKRREGLPGAMLLPGGAGVSWALRF